MKILKIILYLFLALIGIYLVLCLTGSSKFDTERSVSINAAPEMIFEEVNDFNKWPAWSPWSKRDPEMKSTITGNGGTVGHKNVWLSEKEGSGEQQIVEIKPNEYIKTEMKFADWDGVSVTEMILKPEGESTRLSWTMKGSDIPFLARGIFTLMGGVGMLEKDYDEGLNNIKKLAESKPKTTSMSYEVTEIPELIFVGKRMKINEKQTDSALFANTYAELGKAIGGMDKIAGMPFSIGHSYDEATGDMDLEIGLPVAKEMKVPNGLACSKIPAGKCIKYVYTGPYEETGKVWMPLMKEVSEKYKPRYAGYEVYANDPAIVKNKSEYITWLMIPIE